MSKGIGHCPFCDTLILHIRPGRETRPAGAYRSIKFEMADGSFMTTPSCNNCHDDLKEPLPKDLNQKLYKYIKATAPKEWKEDKKEKYAHGFSFKKFKAIVKREGPLKKIDTKNGAKIWQ